MRLIIAGGRDFDDYPLMCEKVSELIKNEKEVVIISGLARGADTLACRFAEETGFELRGFAAEWDRYGRSAGIRRNKYMAQNADALIAFWDGQSRGTEHMIDYAYETGLGVQVVMYDST